MMAHNRWWTLAACLSMAVALASAGAAPAEEAQSILRAAGVKGGLIVHLDCGNGQLTAALRASPSYLVHGLDKSAANVAAARKHIQSLGLYGPVSVDRLVANHLPYVDNLVNLVVAEGLGDVPMVEVMRVLCPSGVAYVKADGRWTRTVKPRPKNIDEWTHYLHDASNNAVAHDTVVGPPKHLQWVGSPAWTRHHDHMSSFTAMVSAGGRVFYIQDEGPRAEIQLPPKWTLTARDAFNGVLLWQRPLASWHMHLWPLKSGPAQLPRRLIAVQDTVYVTLGLGAPVTALDGATGNTVRTYEQTKGAEEILHSEGVLFVLVDPKATARPWSTRPSYASYSELRQEPETWAWDDRPRALMAVEAATGKVLWQAQAPVVPLTMAANRSAVFFHDGAKVVRLDRADGRRVWASKPIARAPKIRSWFAPTLVVYKDVVVFAGGEKILRHRGGKDTMTALSAETGKILWTADHPPSGYDSPEDVLIVDDLVWCAPTTNRRDSGMFTGRDLHTGEVKRTFRADDGNHMPHHRCHRAKATVRFLLMSRTGIEYVDLATQHWHRNDWVRGACLYGIMPANGLTYAPPQSCACYIVAKLNGLNALASAATSAPPAATPRVQEGPALSSIANRKPQAASGEDWPTFRADPARSGHTRTPVPSDLKLAWQTSLGGRLSSPVIARGRVFVASVNAHTVHALDAKTGRELWRFTAGGRVDSPPTVWQGLAIFGSVDGHVYALRASDGALAWRFRAAPADRRLMAWEQLESAWPVHGSVLVREGEVHCVAGRSMFLDGGLRYVRLDAATGRMLSETVLDHINPETQKPLDAGVQWPNLPVALPDVLSCDGRFIYMRSQRFDLEGRRRGVAAPRDFRDQKGNGAHLFCSTGFLDDSWWHRTYWIYGKNPLSAAGGWYLSAYQAPAARIMVHDDERVYGFGRQPQYFPRTTALEYHLFAARKEPKIVGLRGGPPAAAKRRRRPSPTRAAYEWSRRVPALGRALVLAGPTLFMAGPRDVVNQEETIHRLDDAEAAAKLAEQSEAYAGNKGGLLLAVSAADGKGAAAYCLASIPVFDGMAAAHSRLFLSTVSGHVLCLAGDGQPLEQAPNADLEELAPDSYGTASASGTKTHPDFAHLEQVRVTSCPLGWRIRTPSGNVGFALKKLETPLRKRATFQLKMLMIPNPGKTPSGRLPGNAFLAFGDAPDDARLVKCGLRSAGGACMIVQGPLLRGKAENRPVVPKLNEAFPVEVTVDLVRRKVTLTVLGQTVEATLTRPLKSITHVGYAVHSVASEFSPIAITGE